MSNRVDVKQSKWAFYRLSVQRKSPETTEWEMYDEMKYENNEFAYTVTKRFS